MHKVPQAMYQAHKAQNYRMTERSAYLHKQYLERANRQREIVSRNCYAVQRQEADHGKSEKEG